QRYHIDSAVLTRLSRRLKFHPHRAETGTENRRGGQQMFRSYAAIVAVTAALSVLAPATAKAVSTYDLVLHATSGPISGTGFFSITTPALGTSGFDTVANAGLVDMSFSLSNGQVFNLSNATSSGVGFNFNGISEVINTINYTGQLSAFAF